MNNPTQLERYKKLLSFIDLNFTEDIDIQKVEDICHYSYRNINRIFEAIHNETIGKYIKRLRLEKSAQYLKYSDVPISDIGYQVGFEDRAAFSKAFKKKYKLSPSSYRDSNESIRESIQKTILTGENYDRQPLNFEIEYLPNFNYIYLEYRGSHDDQKAIEKIWGDLFEYALKKEIVSERSIIMTEIIDDNEISESIHSRYNFSLVLEQILPFPVQGLFRTKTHRRQKYVKFSYQGSNTNSVAFYREIYAFWMQDVNLELIDLPTLEFYPNYDEKLSEEELITEIYIPVK